MNARLNRRVAKLEGLLRPASQDPAEAAEERLRRGILCTLSLDELELMSDYAERAQEDPGAQPTPAQAAAIATYEQRYREFKATGELVVGAGPWKFDEMNGGCRLRPRAASRFTLRSRDW